MNEKAVGRLEVITGCMFSGKSEELIRRLRRAQIAKQTTLVFKPKIDNRYSNIEVVSHSGVKIDAIPVKDSNVILEYVARYPNVQIIGIDEGQFFEPNIVFLVRELLEQNKRIMVAGLDMDFRGEPFGAMPILMAMADEVLKLHAICTVCGEDAMMTQRIINGRPARYDEQIILIGASETYEARCRKHHEIRY
ncbi:MAG: thymidine kinase [Minisyncoccia bacterium]